MFPVASILLSMLLVQIYAISKATAALVLTASVILVLTDSLAIFLLNYLEEQQQKLHDSSILRHDLKMERDNITAWMNAYTNQRKQTHEYQHQLSVLRGYAAQEAPNGELIRYLDRLLQTDLSQSLFVKTERTVVDVILNQKYALAQSHGITFQMQLDHLAEFALDDDGLVIVLSNLIDNAIEACMQVPDPADRKILLKMRVTPDESFLYIENTTATAAQIVNNQVVTTKTDALEHGYGLKNIDAVLQRVDAAYTLDYQEDTHTFCFSVQIIPDK
jgi:sensor histidine kinase regulating citrate/malate metabolism